MKSLASIKAQIYYVKLIVILAKSVFNKWKDNDKKYISHNFRSLE